MGPSEKTSKPELLLLTCQWHAEGHCPKPVVLAGWLPVLDTPDGIQSVLPDRNWSQATILLITQILSLTFRRTKKAPKGMQRNLISSAR